MAEEVAGDIGGITDILQNSKVGKCGGKCNGFKEENRDARCSECFHALEQESEEIFSVSPLLRLLGHLMNNAS